MPTVVYQHSNWTVCRTSAEGKTLGRGQHVDGDGLPTNGRGRFATSVHTSIRRLDMHGPIPRSVAAKRKLRGCEWLQIQALVRQKHRNCGSPGTVSYFVFLVTFHQLALDRRYQVSAEDRSGLGGWLVRIERYLGMRVIIILPPRDT